MTDIWWWWYSDWLRAGRSWDQIPVGARFSTPLQNGPGDHPACCTMGTVFFPGVKSGQGFMLTPHLLRVPWSRKSRAIPLLPLWALRPVQSLSACTRVHFLTLPPHPLQIEDIHAKITAAVESISAGSHRLMLQIDNHCRYLNMYVWI